MEFQQFRTVGELFSRTELAYFTVRRVLVITIVLIRPVLRSYNMRLKTLYNHVAVTLTLGSACIAGCRPEQPSKFLNVSSTQQQLFLHPTEATPAVILPPVRSGADRLLIIFPGMYKSPEDYLSLAKEIQNQSPFRLWVGILKFTANLVNPPQAQSAVDYVFQQVSASGFSSASPSNTMIAGHSLGGIVAQYFVNKKAYAGLILMSSYLVRSEGGSSLPQADLPVLTLSGELDGQTRMTRVAVDAKSMIAASGVHSAIVKKPVILLSGINHAQFSDGKMARSDLKPEVEYSQAQKKISEVISDFTVANDAASDMQKEADEASKRIIDAVGQTRDLMAPYWSAQTLDDNWCPETQKALIPLTLDPLKLSIEHKVHSGAVAFAASKPQAEYTADGTLSATVHSSVSYHPNVIDRSTVPEAAQNLACKTKSSEALALRTGLPAAQRLTCRDHNVRVYSWALQQVSVTVRERFLNRGRQLRFAPDENLASGLQWVPARLGFEDNPDERFSTVTSKALYTGIEAPFGLAGMHYCKLLSPTRTMEWILVDGLRD